MVHKNWIIVGISGVTCGGKTTLSKALHQKYPSSVIFCQDDYFLPKDSANHTLIPELNHFNWDILTAFNMEKMRSDVQTVLNSTRESESLLIIEGVLILNDKTLSQLCDKKYYITLPYDVCLARRLQRTYDPPDVPGYFDACVWPEYLKSKDEALKMNLNIHVIDGMMNPSDIFEIVSTEVNSLLADTKSHLC